jgi:hypothetical protein
MTFRESLVLLRRHWVLLVVGGIAGLSIGLSMTSPNLSAAQTVTTRTAIEVRSDGSGKANADRSHNAIASGDVGSLLENAVSLGLSDTDYESVANSAALPMPVASLEGAVTYRRIPNSAVLEVTVGLPDYDQAAVVASVVTDLLVRNAEQLSEDWPVEVVVAASSQSERGHAGRGSLLLRKLVLGGAIGLGLGLAATLAAYTLRPTVLGRGTVPKAVGLSIIATVKDHDKGRWLVSTDPRVLVAKLNTAHGTPIMRFIVLICATPDEAVRAGRSQFVEGLAEALGDDALILTSQGDSGCETLLRWENLARVGPYRAQIVLDPSLQTRGEGAAYLAELAAFRPVVLVTSLTALAVTAGSVAGATMPVAFAALTRTARLQSLVLDLREGAVALAGIVLMRT